MTHETWTLHSTLMLHGRKHTIVTDQGFVVLELAESPDGRDRMYVRNVNDLAMMARAADLQAAVNEWARLANSGSRLSGTDGPIEQWREACLRLKGLAQNG